MKKFDEFITEAFDKPYPLRVTKGDGPEPDVWIAKASLGDGRKLVVASLSDSSEPRARTFYFQVDGSTSKTGGGDQQRIFATVMDAARKLIKDLNPDLIFFSSVKSTGPNDKRRDSRAKLYARMIQRFAKPLGYVSSSEKDDSETMFTLRKK